jgi:predicted ester cyclase
MRRQQEATVTATDNLARLRQWTDSCDRGTPAFTETFAPDATIELVGGPPGIRDRESYADAMRSLLAAFPGLQFTVDAQLPASEGGDVVVTRFTARGPHQGDQLGFPATGKSVTLQGIIVDCLRDEKIVD